MIKALQILTYIKGGGAEAVVYNYYSHIDRTKIKFDIVALSSDEEQFLAPKFKELGADIFYLPHNPIKRLFEMARIIRNGHYDIIHSHCEFLSELYLGIARLYGVKVRIMHSHIAFSELPVAKRVYRPFGCLMARHTATGFFACGKNAAISLWGKRAFDAGKCHIVNNAIDLNRFKYSEKERARIRNEFSWTGKKVFVNVGRLNYQKNHKFLIDVFEKYSRLDAEAILVLIGDGELKDEIEKTVCDKNLDSKVIMLGNRRDIPALLNACDCFLLPSLFEGLPVVAVESQANGLPIIMSDNVTKECVLTDIAFYLSLEMPVDKWGECMARAAALSQDRLKYNKTVEDAGFNIDVEAKRLLAKYNDLIYKAQ